MKGQPGLVGGTPGPPPSVAAVTCEDAASIHLVRLMTGQTIAMSGGMAFNYKLFLPDVTRMRPAETRLEANNPKQISGWLAAADP